MEKKKLTKDEKRILREDIQDLKYLAEKYRAEGKLTKAADCEREMDEFKKKLRGDDNGIC